MDEPVPHTPLTKKLEPSYDYIIGEKIWEGILKGLFFFIY
jgi:hypothetical protein